MATARHKRDRLIGSAFTNRYEPDRRTAKILSNCDLAVRLRIYISILASLTLSSVTQAQRAFSVQIQNTNGGPQISWPSQSAVPAGGLPLFPQYVLQRSIDLQNWSDLFTDDGTPGKTFQFVDSGGAPAFYRVETKIVRPYAELAQANLSFGELTGADFFGADLFGATVTSASIDHATLAGADLSFATFDASDLTGSDLFGATAFTSSLFGVSLQNADLSFCDFDSAFMAEADLTGADLSACNFNRADLRLVAFHSTITNNDTVLSEQSRQIRDIVINGAAGATLTNVDFNFANFKGANLSNANFSGSGLFESILSQCDLRGAKFTSADMRFVFLDGAVLDTNTVIDAKSRLVWQIVNNGAVGQNLRATDLSFVTLIGADFRDTIATNVNFGDSLMVRANFGNASLVGANCSSADWTGCVLTNADLIRANFFNAILTRANLRSAVTNGANFAGAVFNQTIMPDGTIRNQ